MDALSATFAALADPTRRAILARLAQGEATVNELAAPFAISLPSVSRHLKVLENAGLISKGREAQWRPRRLEVAPLQDVEAWMETYRAFFESSFDRLEAHLQTMMAQRAVQSPRPGSASEDESATRPEPRARRKPTAD
jgi:DNA-binding transcriptional ArsR family regulator